MQKNDRQSGPWLRQAENDLAAASMLRRRGFFAQTCFMAHQVAEKTLKGLALHRGDTDVTGHSLRELVSSLQTTYPKLSEYQGVFRLLNRYYVPTRYPGDFPGKAPFEVYDRAQARAAMEGAAQVLDAGRSLVKMRRDWWAWPKALFRTLLSRGS
jgi:HEPN domain-containing protein